MKQYRVKQIDERYYPQERICFIWFYMMEGNVLGSYAPDFPDVLSAEGYIKCIIKDRNYKPTVKIHSINQSPIDQEGNT